MSLGGWGVNEFADLTWTLCRPLASSVQRPRRPLPWRSSSRTSRARRYRALRPGHAARAQWRSPEAARVKNGVWKRWQADEDFEFAWYVNRTPDAIGPPEQGPPRPLVSRTRPPDRRQQSRHRAGRARTARDRRHDRRACGSHRATDRHRPDSCPSAEPENGPWPLLQNACSRQPDGRRGRSEPRHQPRHCAPSARDYSMEDVLKAMLTIGASGVADHLDRCSDDVDGGSSASAEMATSSPTNANRQKRTTSTESRPTGCRWRPTTPTLARPRNSSRASTA